MMDKRPHYKPRKSKQAFARELRKRMSEEEILLWSFLREFRKHGYAVKRQAALGPYIADFLCRKARLVIEVDGSQHDQTEQITHDRKRDAWMEAQGYEVLRFSTFEIRKDVGAIVDSIEASIRAKLDLPKC